MGTTFFEKVWRDHAIADLGGDTALLQVDRLVLHEMSGGPALAALSRSGRAPASRAQVYAVIDHV
ncbi:MAG TPA: 3-isopropylmalate dehydratase, partial [Burkholderiaceae bacterium]|nr:3-isopropylmalate dehydratase [Burkholderiaceae bacterium]